MSYSGKEVLKDISLDIGRGEVFAMIGPSGSGKTTLLRLVDLLERPTSGNIYFDGLDTTASEKKRLEIRRRMAMVPQKPTVFNASVYDNVAYGLRVRGQRGTDMRGKVTQALEIVGLGDYAHRNARTLSGGEVQRVVLVRAAVIEPEVLLLDEPTANLDPVSTAHIERLIADIIRQLNTTVILATHDMSQGQRLADRLGVLMEGQMLQTGDPRDVFGLPQSKEVAAFVGVENILEGSIANSNGGIVTIDIGGTMIEAVSNLGLGEEVSAFIRPEQVTVAPSRTSSSARNVLAGKITKLLPTGALARIEMDCGFRLVALVTRRSIEELDLQIGHNVYASFKATGVHVIRRRDF
jgi:tungstate transport system ATP-binding protein